MEEGASSLYGAMDQERIGVHFQGYDLAVIGAADMNMRDGNGVPGCSVPGWRSSARAVAGWEASKGRFRPLTP